RAIVLHRVMRYAAVRKVAGKGEQVGFGQPARAPGGSTFERDAAAQQCTQAGFSGCRSARPARERVIALGIALDVEPHPVEVGKQSPQTCGIDAGRVQRHPKAERADTAYHLDKLRLAERFASREYDGIEKPAAALQEFKHGMPVVMAGACLQMRVMAVPATPGTAGDEHHAGKYAGPVDTRERDEATDAWLAPRYRGNRGRGRDPRDRLADRIRRRVVRRRTVVH